MKYFFFPFVTLMGTMILFSSCDKDDDTACTETTWYEDADSDGLGNPDISQDACEQPTGYVADNSDTNDVLDETSYSFSYNGQNYTLIKEASSWLDAASYAVAKGGYLAEINSAEEQTAIFSEL